MVTGTREAATVEATSETSVGRLVTVVWGWKVWSFSCFGFLLCLARSKLQQKGRIVACLALSSTDLSSTSRDSCAHTPQTPYATLHAVSQPRPHDLGTSDCGDENHPSAKKTITGLRHSAHTAHCAAPRPTDLTNASTPASTPITVHNYDVHLTEQHSPLAITQHTASYIFDRHRKLNIDLDPRLHHCNPSVVYP